MKPEFAERFMVRAQEVKNAQNVLLELPDNLTREQAFAVAVVKVYQHKESFEPIQETEFRSIAKRFRETENYSSGIEAMKKK